MSAARVRASTRLLARPESRGTASSRSRSRAAATSRAPSTASTTRRQRLCRRRAGAGTGARPGGRLRLLLGQYDDARAASRRRGPGGRRSRRPSGGAGGGGVAGDRRSSLGCAGSCALLDRVPGCRRPGRDRPGTAAWRRPRATAAPYQRTREALSSRAVLTVVPTPLGNLRDITLRALDALRAAASVIACEDTRRTRALLSAHDIPAPELVACDERARAAASPSAWSPRALAGRAGRPRLGRGHAADRRSGPRCSSRGALAAGCRGHGAARPERGRDRARRLRPRRRGLRVPRLGAAGRGRARRASSRAALAAALPSVVFESPRRLAADARRPRASSRRSTRSRSRAS